MTQQNLFIPPITEVDLALFAEGLLTLERSAQVHQFLLDHPELRDLAWMDQPSEDPIASSMDSLSAATQSASQSSNTEMRDITSAAPIPTASAGSDTDTFVATIAPLTISIGNHALDSRSALKVPDQGFQQRFSKFNRILAIASAAMGLLILTTFWRAAEAVERTLSETESVLRTELAEGGLAGTTNSMDLVPQVLNSRIALEQLEHSFWLSERNSLRRDRLLAAIYVTQARLEQANFSQLKYALRPQEFPPLDLCHMAVELLKPQASDELARQILANANQLRGQIHYLFGTMLRSAETRSQGVLQTGLAADSLLTALELLPPEKAGSAQCLQISGLLFKSLHKGGFAGKLTDEHGSEAAAITVLLPRLSKQFPSLAGMSPASSSSDTSQTEFQHQIIDRLGAWLVQQPVSDEGQAVAMMDICNSYGLRLTNGRGTLEQTVTSFNSGLAFAETVSSEQRSTEYQMTYGRLLGNMADAFGQFNQLEEEVKWRPRAIAVFRQISSQQRTEESFFELGWVTARQLIAEYRMHVRYPDRPSLVPELLGALRQISNDLSSLNGYQLSDFEDELVYAIFAESTEDHNLGRGADKILRHAQSRQPGPSVSDERLRSLIEDFRGNVYLKQLPTFQEAQKIFETSSAR